MKQLKVLFPVNKDNQSCHPCNNGDAVEFVAVFKQTPMIFSSLPEEEFNLKQCERLFAFCQNHVEGYEEMELRSMSVGDIVSIDDQTYYIYKDTGWERIEMYHITGTDNYLVASKTSTQVVDESTVTYEGSFGVILSKVLDCSLACKHTDEAFQMRKLREECAELLLEDLRAQDGREGANPDSEAYDVVFRSLAWLLAKDGIEEFKQHLNAKLHKYQTMIKR